MEATCTEPALKVFASPILHHHLHLFVIDFSSHTFIFPSDTLIICTTLVAFDPLLQVHLQGVSDQIVVCRHCGAMACTINGMVTIESLL
jgi:hypothetical protein